MDSRTKWHKHTAQTSKSCIVEGSKKFTPKMTTPNPQLDILMSREQLMEDIDAIVDSFDRDFESNDDLVCRLCDAVCRNFPAK